jgi:autotransporter-associated beta strand protein
MAGTALTAPMAAATAGGPLILSGKYIKVGLNETGGTLGYDNNTSPGILYDGTGTGTFNAGYDYLTPGTAYEGFAIKGSAGSAFSFHNNNSALGSVGIAGGALVSYSGVAYDGATYDQRAVWSATVTNGGANLFTISHDYYFNDAGQQLNIVTTIEALTDLTGLSFGRFTDPDARAAAGDSSATNNFQGSGSVAASDLVYAEALASKYVIGLYSNDSATHNSGVAGFPWSFDPLFYLSGDNDGNGDNSIGLGFDLGDLLSGGKVTFKYQYIFGTDIAAAIGANGGGGGGALPDIAAGGSFTPEDVLGGKVNPVFDGGTLNLGASASINSAFTVREAGGTINTGGHDLTISGSVQGEGALTKTGEGVLTLTGANSQNGLDIQGGTVAFNGGGALGSGTITMSGGGALRSDRDSTVSQGLQIGAGQQGGFNTAGHNVQHTGDINGGGGLIKTGAGTLTLTGNNSHGSLDIQGGSVVAGSANALGAPGGQITLGNGAGLVAGSNMTVTQGLNVQGENSGFDTAGHDVTMNGVLTGQNCFVKSGTGTLSLNAAGSNAIGACVQQGQLAFNNVFAGQVWVDDGGTMSGSGRVNGNVEVDGTLSPGNSPGVLVVAGSVAQAAGSTLALDIDGPTAGNGAGHHDQLVLSGAGSVYTAGGTITAITRGITGSATNTYTPQIGDSFQVVSAEGGVTGAFAAITQPTEGLAPDSRFDVLYLPKAVVLAVTPNSYAALARRAGKLNAQAVGRVVDADRLAPGQRDAGLAGGLVGLKQPQLLDALQQASGEIHADGMEAVLASSRATRTEVTDRLEIAFGARKVWGVAGADTWEIDADQAAYGYRTDRASMIFGIDQPLSDDLLVGAAVSYAETEVDGRGMGSARTVSYQLHGYGAWRSGDNYVNGVVAAGLDDYKLTRSVTLANGARAYLGKADGASLSADVEAGRRYTVGRADLVLAAGLAADRAERDAVSEDGETTGALRFASETRTAVQGRVGGRISTQTQAGAIKLRPLASMFVTQEFGDDTTTLGARMGQNSFDVMAASAGETAVKLSTQLDAAISDRTRVSLGYRYGWTDASDSHAIRAAASFTW